MLEEVINNGFCIGCGACSVVEASPYIIKFDDMGMYQAVLSNKNAGQFDNFSSVCPFSNKSKNENEISRIHFGNNKNIIYNKYLGYYLKAYAGFVAVDMYRGNGSSGGFVSWLSTTLLKEKMVDYIIHVKPTNEKSSLFAYAISSSIEEILEGAKSKYYPVEMSKVLEIVKKIPGKYLIIGVPCFIKAVNLLVEKDSIFETRIVYTIGLVCGHLKTDRFAKSIGWELGIHPNDLQYIDFRVKLPGNTANSYAVAVKGKTQKDTIFSPMKKLIVSNWGYGLFRYKACDYCDDVVGETADVSIGDAWLPEYVEDGLGANIVIVRNQDFKEIIERHICDLDFQEISAENVYRSQAGGFRHKREGLSYRLYLADMKKEWRPLKRVEPISRISQRRKLIYEQRIEFLNLANKLYDQALIANNFLILKNTLEPYLLKYTRLYYESLPNRLLKKIVLTFKNLMIKNKRNNNAK